MQILAAQTRKFLLHADVDLTAVATTLPPNVTGADIGALSSAAYGRALEKKLQLLREGARLALLCSTRYCCTLRVLVVRLKTTIFSFSRVHRRCLSVLFSSVHLVLHYHVCCRGSNSSAFSVGVEILPVDASTTGTNASAGGEPSDAEVRSYVNSLPRAQLQVRVAQEDFLWAAAGVQPSVTDLNYYESMGDTYNDA